MAKSCGICGIIKKLETGDPCELDHFIAELDTGYAVLNNVWQFFRGYTLFCCKRCVTELHELEPSFRKQYLYDMSLVAHAVYRAVKPDKLNYELLGNGCGHLHFHIIPRFQTESKPGKPIWETERSVFDSVKLERPALVGLRDRIRAELTALL